MAIARAATGAARNGTKEKTTAPRGRLRQDEVSGGK
jgi:hypothetical protein